MLKRIFLLSFFLAGCNFVKEEIEPSSIRVEVLNGAGERHLARIVSMELRRRGFDVIRFDNAEDTLKNTIIFDRKSPDKKYAEVLAKSIGCKRVKFEPDPQRICEVTIIIGKDYKKIFKDNLLFWR